jgi:hypothetical protein
MLAGSKVICPECAATPLRCGKESPGPSFSSFLLRSTRAPSRLGAVSVYRSEAPKTLRGFEALRSVFVPSVGIVPFGRSSPVRKVRLIHRFGRDDPAADRLRIGEESTRLLSEVHVPCALRVPSLVANETMKSAFAACVKSTTPFHRRRVSMPLKPLD